jgi:hypothetical protein
MHPLETLHQTLRIAGLLLDSAASQIRDAPLPPVRDNILKIGTALAEVSELRLDIHRTAPELNLEQHYEKSSPEELAANRQLGHALLAADEFASKGKYGEAASTLEQFAQGETSELHRAIALTQAQSYRQRTEP